MVCLDAACGVLWYGRFTVLKYGIFAVLGYGVFSVLEYIVFAVFWCSVLLCRSTVGMCYFTNFINIKQVYSHIFFLFINPGKGGIGNTG